MSPYAIKCIEVIILKRILGILGLILLVNTNNVFSTSYLFDVKNKVESSISTIETAANTEALMATFFISSSVI